MSLEEYAEKHWKSVVLCKECKHYHKTPDSKSAKICNEWFIYPDDDGWCWKGEGNGMDTDKQKWREENGRR